MVNFPKRINNKGIAVFQIFSDINIEGGTNPDLCLQTKYVDNISECPSWFYTILVLMNLTHLT